MSAAEREPVASVVTPRLRVNAARQERLQRQHPWLLVWVLGGAAVILGLMSVGIDLPTAGKLLAIAILGFLITPRRRGGVKEPCSECGGELAMLPRKGAGQVLSPKVKACLYCGTDMDGGERHEPQCRHGTPLRSSRQKLEFRRRLSAVATGFDLAVIFSLLVGVVAPNAMSIWVFGLLFLAGVLEIKMAKREQCPDCNESLEMLPAESRWRCNRPKLARGVMMCPYCCEDLR